MIPSGASAYSCLSTALLDEHSLRLAIVDAAVDELGLGGPNLDLRLDLDASRLAELIAGLLSVLGGPGPTPSLEGLLQGG